MRVTLATCAAHPTLTTEDRVVASLLRDLACDVRAADWRDAPAWEEPGLVVLRSTWDYHHHFDEFLRWLDTLAARGVAVRNPVPMLRWNARKRYLEDLGADGVRVVPTVTVRDAAAAHALAGASPDGASRLVVKPEVSASAHRTWVADAPIAESDAERIAVMTADGAVLVQPFVEEITTAGELSLIHFDGVFSHAVRKRPTPGDFRVQHEFGGVAESVTPSPATLDASARVLAAATARTGARPLYARVDGVERADGFALMELELIEPALFLATADGAAERFADAIVRAGSA